MSSSEALHFWGIALEGWPLRPLNADPHDTPPDVKRGKVLFGEIGFGKYSEVQVLSALPHPSRCCQDGFCSHKRAFKESLKTHLAEEDRREKFETVFEISDGQRDALTLEEVPRFLSHIVDAVGGSTL